MSDEAFIPGRTTCVRGLQVSNARRMGRQTNPGRHPARYAPAEWGVRFGSDHYPDYATPHPTLWDGSHGGYYLSPDDADALAEALTRAAAWARAQEALEPSS